MKRPALHKQRGAAMIVFVGMLPVMMMLFAFAMHLAQQMLAHARLLEAAEVASLAVAAQHEATQSQSEQLAQQVVDFYIKDNVGALTVTVGQDACTYASGCMQDAGELAPSMQTDVQVHSRYDSWLSFDAIGIKEQFELKGGSLSKRYLPKPVDVYLIVDFSYSMSWAWTDGQTKYAIVKDTLSRVVDQLKLYNKYNQEKSRIALIGFNRFSVRKVGGTRTLYNMDIYDNINETVAHMFEDKPAASNYYQSYSYYYPKNFHDIPLTEDYDHFLAELDTMTANARNAGTYSWQGMLRAAVVSDEATNLNPDQVFIVLSDGHDNTKTYNGVKTNRYLKMLVGAGLCQQLFDNMRGKTGRHGEAISVKAGVIGVDFLLDKESNGFYDCVGERNIYHASQGPDVYKYILQMLNEETGRLE
ncbi:TadE/TadG family type IV pilus assembly protein [Ferrimonas sediminum]|nr:VWA domain-containing protein [Ferrimonas sediminum]